MPITIAIIVKTSVGGLTVVETTQNQWHRIEEHGFETFQI